MTKKNLQDFKNSTQCWMFDNVYVDGDFKLRDYCYVTEKHRGSTHIDCNIKVKLNHTKLLLDSAT